jgi:DNA-binding CsgD family transcriptional regulator
MHSHLANAKLTKSAKNALDTSGKHLFACDSSGQVLWATPQCQMIFTKLMQGRQELSTQITDKINAVIQGGTTSRITARIKCDEDTHELVYVGASSDNDHLLQMNKLLEQFDIEILKNELGLTHRESEVLFWTSKGKTNREVGLVLSMSPRTVNKHLEQIYKKMNVENRTAAASACVSLLNKR